MDKLRQYFDPISGFQNLFYYNFLKIYINNILVGGGMLVAISFGNVGRS